MEKYIDPIVWYGERQLGFTPKHFVKTRTPITSDSEQWILNVLKGRFSLYMQDEMPFDSYLETSGKYPAFEDPAEAVLYELTWG